jgi:hypothetical protein
MVEGAPIILIRDSRFAVRGWRLAAGGWRTGSDPDSIVPENRGLTPVWTRKDNHMPKILIITGDGGEAYETWFAVHRFQEAGYQPQVAAPSKRRLHLVMHDFEPGWDTYKEGPATRSTRT